MNGKICNAVKISRHSHLTSNTRFRAVVIADALRTSIVRKSGLIVGDNVIQYSNSVHMSDVDNDNSVRINNSVVYSRVAFANGLQYGNSVIYSKGLSIGNSLNAHRVDNRAIHLGNILGNRSIGDETLRIRPLHDAVFSHFSVSKCRSNDAIHRVATIAIRTGRLRYQALATSSTVLHGNDTIRDTAYTATLNVSHASDILLIGKSYRHVRLGATWDECSSLP